MARSFGTGLSPDGHAPTGHEASPVDPSRGPSDGWSTDFAGAEEHNGDVLAGARTRLGAWRQAVVGYAGGIFWDWPFRETPTHWCHLPEPPAQGIEVRQDRDEGSACESPVVEDNVPAPDLLSLLKTAETDLSAALARVERLEKALHTAQSALAMLTEPNEIRSTSVANAWAVAVDAELQCRRALKEVADARSS